MDVAANFAGKVALHPSLLESFSNISGYFTYSYELIISGTVYYGYISIYIQYISAPNTITYILFNREIYHFSKMSMT